MATETLLFAIRELSAHVKDEGAEREARARGLRTDDEAMPADASTDDFYELGHAEGMACAHRGLARRLDDLARAVEADRDA